jgi:hypothetical protein
LIPEKKAEEEKKGFLGGSLNDLSELTPIKTAKAEVEKFDSQDMSLLPGVSKHSPDKNSSSGLSIQPASHVLYSKIHDKGEGIFGKA